ncbi:helix-turn-helix domain-containing protein [Rhizobium sp. SL42]|uniref:helix-turn-helix domain-containing protein n=1 Tax=Rhizobium sp. SL42 TaxID=2806346 RepID=UPI001F1FFECD|nr:helix-turn-helix domain-containing protein [Rhizobium sp. SL42]UJW73539.1 helix-turn-helix domain-containing protein [Rhizobium sp. SL42]
MPRSLKRIIRKRKPAPGGKIAVKWGTDALEQGFTVVPNKLIYSQGRLGIDAIEMNVLLHMMSYWWDPGRFPYPSNLALSTRMSVHERTIQRATKSLREKGLIKVVARYRHQRNNGYDLNPLIAKIKAIELTYGDHRE